jgi:hypothetical protein
VKLLGYVRAVVRSVSTPFMWSHRPPFGLEFGAPPPLRPSISNYSIVPAASPHPAECFQLLRPVQLSPVSPNRVSVF